MILVNVHYRDETGDYMDTLWIWEIDPQSPYVANVYKVEHNGQIYTEKEAQTFLTELANNAETQRLRDI